MHRFNGFTLVEVLVAMMIMSIVAIMAWQGVDGIVRTRDATQIRLEQTLRLNTVIAQWEQDLALLQDSNVAPGFSFDGASVRLTRRAETGLQLVVWSLAPGLQGAPSGGTLLRWAAAPVTDSAALQNQWERSQQFQGQESGQLRALSGIEQWKLYCFRANAWSNCQSSSDVEPAADGASAPPRDALPSGVRLVLGFAPGSGLNGSLTRDVQLGPQQQ